MDVKKSQRVPPFTFFGTVTLFKNLILKIFSGKFFQVPKGLPFNFFPYFATSWSFTKPEGSPFTILSLIYSADFGRSRLVSLRTKNEGSKPLWNIFKIFGKWPFFQKNAFGSKNTLEVPCRKQPQENLLSF